MKRPSVLTPEEQAIVQARTLELNAQRATSDPRRPSNQAYVESWRRRNRNAHRALQIKRLYGISWADYQALLASQSHRCAICRSQFPASGRQPHVDHCHQTKAIRGILCSHCNMRLGWLEHHADAIGAYLSQPTQARMNGQPKQKVASVKE